MSQSCARCQRVLDLPGPVAFCPYCGQSLTETVGLVTAPGTHPADYAADPPPERLGEYRLLRELGRGGMGVVYEGEHEPTGRRVAVKLIDVRASDTALHRFRQEGKLASAVSHPRCVFVFAADEDAGRPFIVLELMPGRTLEDLVRERGPLPVGEAVAHALDLIEGLEQVHALGVLHRDVKPSNCFLDADGRLKVGDFGLARSLAPEEKLTRTGAFVGTPLFASPEQIKAQPLDARSDVYSVAATAYFLLTGSAPHEGRGRDSMAVLASVVSEDAPPARSRRRDVPAGLDRVLARGLARDRDRRFADLASLRAELAAFARPEPGWGSLAGRFVAYLIDLAAITPLSWLAMLAQGQDPFSAPPSVASHAAIVLIAVAYYALAEGTWGAGVGKWLMDLRVRRAGDIGPPGVAVAAWRALACSCLTHVPMALVAALLPVTTSESALVLAFSNLAVLVLTRALMLGTVRRSNGYACLHDLVSGTRVVPVPARQAALRLPPAPARSEAVADAPRSVGPFRVRGEVWRGGRTALLVGVDPALDRAVWLWVRPAGDAPVSATRREAYRGARPRWLAHGEQDGLRWDAFLVPGGLPLTEAVNGRPLDWERARPVLERLAEGLEGSAGEDALSDRYSLSQVWLTAEGRAVLIDLPSPGAEALPPGELLRAAAVTLLEGAPRDGASEPRARLPGHARRLLQELARVPDPVRAFREALTATRERPARLTRSLRLAHLALLVPAQAVCFSCAGFMTLALGVVAVAVLGFQLTDGRAALADVERERVALTAALVAAPPGARLAAAWSLAELSADGETLAAAVRRGEAYRAARLARLAPAMQRGVERNQGPPRRPVGGAPYRRGQTFAATVDRVADGLPDMVPLAATLLLLPLGACVLSAVIFRGGVRYLLLGVEVVRGDGRPAGRVRCGWRALAAWGPVLLPLGLARWVEESYWRQWTPEGGSGWLLGLATVCWLAAAVVPLLYLLAIVLTPARGPHDRLAGTWLVPR